MDNPILDLESKTNSLFKIKSNNNSSNFRQSRNQIKLTSDRSKRSSPALFPLFRFSSFNLSPLDRQTRPSHVPQGGKPGTGSKWDLKSIFSNLHGAVKWGIGSPCLRILSFSRSVVLAKLRIAASHRTCEKSGLRS